MIILNWKIIHCSNKYRKKISLLIKFFFFFEIVIIFFKGKIFSEIYIKNHYLKKHIIVSLTTSKKNLKFLLVDRLIKSLINQTILPYKILISVKNKDLGYISDYLKLWIKNNIIEIIFVKEDFENFNKYYYIPNKYKKFIIIVVDDNIILEKNSIEKLFKSYLLYPNAISARRVYKMNFNKNWILQPFSFWNKDYKKEKKPKFSLFPIHGAGTLFPPNILNLTNDFVFYFKRAIKAHDFIIKYFELKENLKTVYVDNINNYSPLNIEFYEKYNKILTISPNEYQLREDFKKTFNCSIYNNIIKEKIVISNLNKEYFLNTKNKNKISNDTLLVSMTSYPARISGIYEVFISLLNQSADISSYQCFLTLAKAEFINGEKDLPINIQKLILNGWIKLIWYHNIYSHKKLIPIMKNYPENDILIVDDDIIRTNNFIEIFQKEHRIYPTDIICGIFMYYFDSKIEMKRLNGYKSERFGEMNSVPNIIFQTSRPANGFGGVLYPKHTFSDKRFFNEALFMKLCPTSDESWQYAFNIIENKILRQTSIIFDNSFNIVENSQKFKLFKVNQNKYPFINDNLMNLFPEYKINSFKRQKKIIVSLTSYKHRLKKLNLVLESIFNNTMKPSKIVLSLYKDDILFLTQYLKDMISNKSIELIVTDIDLKSHNKYFHVMKKYRDYAIITIDDDIIITNDLIETLYNSYLKYPNCIHSRSVDKIITDNNNEVLSYSKWLKQYTFELNPSFYLFAESGRGTLFPPNILNISDENIDEIFKCITAADMYLKYLSRKRNIKILWVPNKFLLGLEQIKFFKNKKEILYKRIRNEKLNDICLRIFPII